MSEIFKLKIKDVSSAVLSGVIVALLSFLGGVTDITTIDWTALLNLVVLTSVTSLLKSLGTDSGGKFLGAVKIK